LPRMEDIPVSVAYQIVVCAGIVPDPLQTLEPVTGAAVPSLKNEMMLPHVLDPWAACSLWEAAHFAGKNPGSKVYLVSIAPKAKLQQVMMSVAQKAPFELVALDGPAGGFTESADAAAAIAAGIEAIPGLDKSKLLVFGGWESASRGSGATLQMVGEKLGIVTQFQGVDELAISADGSMQVLERVEGGKHQVSTFSSPPAVLGWATGSLAEPPNNPQVGMVNMRAVMPALQKARPAAMGAEGVTYSGVTVPKQVRQTRIVRDVPLDQMADEIAAWVSQG